jgi:23S rRNA pseudoU1915 N3-methylase RlmH
MTAFLNPAIGGLQPINGKNGGIINDIIKAEQGKPGQNIVVNSLNQIIAATQLNLPRNNCDPQGQLVRAQQKVQQQVQLILTNYITQLTQEVVNNSATIKSLSTQLATLQQTVLSESVSQQIEIVEKDIQKELNVIIVGVVGRASQSLPQAAKVANTSAAGIKTIASVAESLSSFVPSQGINMSAYSNVGQKSIQTVSQSCFL